jgi:hypothetical protein
MSSAGTVRPNCVRTSADLRQDFRPDALGIRMWTREPVPADLQSVLTACGVTVEQAPAWRVDVAVGTTGGETVVLRLL